MFRCYPYPSIVPLNRHIGTFSHFPTLGSSLGKVLNKVPLHWLSRSARRTTTVLVYVTFAKQASLDCRRLLSFVIWGTITAKHWLRYQSMLVVLAFMALPDVGAFEPQSWGELKSAVNTCNQHQGEQELALFPITHRACFCHHALCAHTAMVWMSKC